MSNTRNLQHDFFRSIRWNTVESLLYHGIFLAHQLVLFQTITASLYGLVGTAFSFIYLVVTFMNFGLDASLSPFFPEWSQSKQSFRWLIFMQLAPNYAVGLLIITSTYIFLYFTPQSNLNILVDSLSLFVITTITLLESTRKTARVILQILFKNHILALAEIAMIASYSSIVWGLYYIYGSLLTVSMIIIPMALVSFFSTIYLLATLYRWYQQLPMQGISNTYRPRIIKSRFFTTLHQLGTLIYSSNFLVPLLALYGSLEYAGILKIISTVLYSVSTFLQKIFGTTSYAVLANIKNKQLATKRSYFALMTGFFYQALLCMAIFGVINYKVLLRLYHIDYMSVSFPLILFSFILILTNNALLTYEKFYIAEERAKYLILINILTLFATIGVLTQIGNISLLMLLCIAIAIRLISLCLLGILSFYLWQLRPALQIQPQYILSSFVVAMLFFFFTR